MTDGISRLLIGDKGYIRLLLSEALAQQGIELQTPLRKNMIDSRPKAFVKQLISMRQLVERFHIEKIRVRDLWHITNRFIRKLLAHTVGVFLNFSSGQQLLQFEALVQI
jgi:hypothetical protein